MATDPVRPATSTRKAKAQTQPDMRVPRRKFANKRAPLACQFCRKRKVRCDAAVHGQPCSNCRHDGYTCEMSPKKEKPRGSKHRKDSDSESSSSGFDISSAVLELDWATFTLETQSKAAKQASELENTQSPQSTDLRPSSRPVTQNGLPGARPLGHASTSHFSYCPSEVSSSAASFGGAILIPESDYDRSSDYGTISSPSHSMRPPSSIPVSHTHTLTSNPPPSSIAASHTHTLTSNLPPYIRPLSPDLGPDEISYLRKKGALTVPEKWLREKLLACYMESVHWHVPAVALPKLVETIQRADGMTGKISLMLLQAIMFTGVGFVQEEHLEAAGFTSREHALGVHFNRVKLLYDLDCETDRMTVIQSLLLLSFGCSTSNSPASHEKDTWHWLGISTSLCYGSRLNRFPASQFLHPEKKRLWKRIWWSCYVLDQMTALKLHCRPRIHRQDFNVPLLGLEDFEIEEEGGKEMGMGLGGMRQCAGMYVDKVVLCLHIGWPEPQREEKVKKSVAEGRDGEGWADMFTDLVEMPDESGWEQGLEWAGLN